MQSNKTYSQAKSTSQAMDRAVWSEKFNMRKMTWEVAKKFEKYMAVEDRNRT